MPLLDEEEAVHRERDASDDEAAAPAPAALEADDAAAEAERDQRQAREAAELAAAWGGGDESGSPAADFGEFDPDISAPGPVAAPAASP